MGTRRLFCDHPTSSSHPATDEQAIREFICYRQERNITCEYFWILVRSSPFNNGKKKRKKPLKRTLQKQ